LAKAKRLFDQTPPKGLTVKAMNICPHCGQQFSFPIIITKAEIAVGIPQIGKKGETTFKPRRVA